MQRSGHTLALTALAALLAIALLLTAGCIDFTLDTTINADGSGKRAIDMGLDKGLSELLKIRGKYSAADLQKQLATNLPPNARVRTYLKNGSTHYAATFEFASVSELSRITRGASRQRGRGGAQVTLTRGGNLLFATYTFTENLPPTRIPLTAQETSLTQGFDITYRLTLPGTIVSSNADRLVGNSTGVWKLDIAKGRLIRATSQVIMWPFVAAGAILVFLAIAAAIVIFIVRARPGQEGAPDMKVEP